MIKHVGVYLRISRESTENADTLRTRIEPYANGI